MDKPSTTSTEEHVVSPGSDLAVRKDNQFAAATAPEDTLDLGPMQFGSGWSAYLHSIRRRWPVGLGIGLVLGSLLGGVAWSLQKSNHTAKALLRVSAEPEHLVFDTADRATNRSFGIFKSTQRQLLKSDFVLIAALRPPTIARLSTVQEQSDPVAWLSKNLRVEYPGDAEVMEVQLTGHNPHHMKALVQSVVDAYKSEVLDKEWTSRTRRIDELDRLIEEKKTEVLEKQKSLKTTVETVGTTDSEALALQQQFAVQQYGQYRSEHMKAVFESRRLRTELTAQEALLAGSDNWTVPLADLEEFAQRDPLYSQLTAEKKLQEVQLEDTLRSVKPGAFQSTVERNRHELEVASRAMEARLQELRETYQRQRLADIKARIESLKHALMLAEEQERLLAQDVERQRQKMQAFGGSSIDVALMKAEIDRAESILNTMADEREQLRVESNSRPRIEVVQAPEVRQIDNRFRRYGLTLFSALVGLGLPLVVLVRWDVRSRTVNSQQELFCEVGLPVMGSVPLVPARTIERADAVSYRERRWQALLNESMNGIVAKIMTRPRHDRGQIVVVSSAISGEGKTTLATQLAVTLAGLGKRTLLVDFDLRRPRVHRLFAVPASPGVAEAVRGESGKEAGIHATSIPDLSVLPAGDWEPRSLGALANGATEMFLREISESFDYVIADTSPVLPVADTRLIVRYADVVLLSVFRDVSRVPNVIAAAEMLSEFGAPHLSAVVTGDSEPLYRRYYYGEEQVPRRPKPAGEP